MKLVMKFHTCICLISLNFEIYFLDFPLESLGVISDLNSSNYLYPYLILVLHFLNRNYALLGHFYVTRKQEMMHAHIWTASRKLESACTQQACVYIICPTMW